MTRKNRTPEENARREKIRELLQMANIGSMDDIQSLFKEAISEFMENGLEAELDDELGYSKYDYKNKDTDNSRNGHSNKTLRTSFGDVAVSVPRDRKGEFEPQVLKKNQTSISQDIEEKILSMYAKGMTAGDIEAHIQDIYGVEVSDTTVSRITDKILPIAKEWQQRPLESVYAVVFLDAIHYHVRSVRIPLTSGKLNTYLADINEQAAEQMRLLITQMAEREGVTEQLKAQDQMLWIQRMNNIRERAMEYINHDLIYA